MLLIVIVAVALVLTFEMRRIVLGSARVKVDQIGSEISRQIRGTSALSAIGDALSPDVELTLPGNLDRYASPTTYVEIDNAQGYPEGKSSNMGGATFTKTPHLRAGQPSYDDESNARLGEVLVRSELVQYPGTALVVKVGESLALYDRVLSDVRTLLLLLLGVAAVVVVAGSYAIASSAIEPIDRLVAAMREIGSEQLSRRLGWQDRSDEIGTLAKTFDEMLARLEEAFARERQFISDASHELKSPLTVINANAQMLERWADRDPEIRADSLRAIADESASLARMVNGMLTLAKAEAGDGIPRAPVALDETLAEAVRLSEPRAHEKGLVLRYEPPPGDGTVVLGDANLLRQLFTNLIENAIKFTEEGEIGVDARTEGDRAVVEVSDTGVGIDDEALERVFDRFFRADRSRNRNVPGTGLGLAIVRSIARIHDGTVEARRNSARGTTFRVTLPLQTS